MIRQRTSIAGLPAYVQGGSAPGAIKLSSNESPFPPLPAVEEAVRRAAGGIHLYPEIAAGELTGRLAARHGVRGKEIALGAGSVEVTSQLIAVCAGAGDEVVFAWRSFEAYPRLVQIAGAVPVPVPLAHGGGHDLVAMADAVTERTRLVLVCSPNNPTGTSVARRELEAFLAAVPRDVLVVIDEAYVQFNDHPEAADGLDFFRRHGNVAVLRTFSKAYGLAGLRIGYAIAPEQIVTSLRRVAMPFGVTELAQRAALASLEAEDELAARVSTTVFERARVLTRLRESGWDAPDSFGNFIWLRTRERTPAVHQHLREHGVVTRPFDAEGIRVTIGRVEMNDAFLAAIKEVAPR